MIKVIFISDDPEHSCKEEYDGRDSQGRRAGYGDGSTWFLWKGKGYEQAINKEEVSEYTKKHAIKWSAILTLHFIIPAIHGVLGLWKFQTKGDKSSIPQIRDTFDKIQDMAGTVINIPFDLIVKKVKSQNPGSTSVFPVVSLVPNLSQESMEVLKGYLQGGGSIGQLGLLSESKLASMRQLEAKTEGSPGKSDNVQQDGEFTAYTEIKE